MKAILFSAAVLAMLAACGGNKSQVDTCSDVGAAVCAKQYSCDYPHKIGTSESNCKTVLAEGCKTLAAINTTKDPCSPGEKYDTSMAEKCINEGKAQSCADFNAGVEPEACSHVCI